MNDCSWYFTNFYDLNRILKAQRSSPLINIPQRTLYSSDHTLDNDNTEISKDSNFYVVVSGGANVSSKCKVLYFF